MSSLDIAVLVGLAVSLAVGVWRGLVYEVLSVLSWIVAFVLAQWLAPDAAARLPLGGTSDAVRYAAGFVVVFVGAAFLGGLIAWGLRKLVSATGLGLVDRMLGAAFGVVRGVVLLLALAVVVNMTPLHGDTWWSDSVSAELSTVALRGLKPALPARLGHYLPD